MLPRVDTVGKQSKHAVSAHFADAFRILQIEHALIKNTYCWEKHERHISFKMNLLSILCVPHKGSVAVKGHVHHLVSSFVCCLVLGK